MARRGTLAEKTLRRHGAFLVREGHINVCQSRQHTHHRPRLLGTGPCQACGLLGSLAPL